MKARVLAFSIVAIAFGSACSALVSFDYLAGPPLSDGGFSEASANDAIATDGANDATANDGAIVDAGFDAFCSDGAVFCDDFERDADVQGAWSSTYLKLAALTLDPRDGGGTALHAHVQSAGDRYAFLQKNFSSTMTNGRVSFDVMVPPIATGQAYPFELSFGPGGSSAQRSIDISQNMGTTQIYDQLTTLDGGDYLTDSQNFLVTIGDDNWHHIDVFISLTGSGNSTERVNVDGEEVVPSHKIYSDFTPAAPYIQVGIPYASSDLAALDVMIDNVVVAF